MHTCPLCGKPVELGEPYALHQCTPRVTALEYYNKRGQRIVYNARYGWRLQRGRLVLGRLTLDEVVRLIEQQGFTPKETDSDE